MSNKNKKKANQIPTPLIAPIVDEQPKRQRASNKRYDIEIIEESGKVLIFRTLTDANKYYGVRKDYLNYCFIPENEHYLKENGLNIKSIRRLKDNVKREYTYLQ